MRRGKLKQLADISVVTPSEGRIFIMDPLIARDGEANKGVIKV